MSAARIARRTRRKTADRRGVRLEPFGRCLRLSILEGEAAAKYRLHARFTGTYAVTSAEGDGDQTG
jgi:hypothetical protein